MIIKVISNRYTVLREDNSQVIAIGSGKLKQTIKPLAGDHIRLVEKEDAFVMEEVYPRRNFLVRPPMANIDQALIVMSAVKPDFSTQLVDRMMWLVAYEAIEPVLVVTKLDLVDESHPVHEALTQYENEGIKVIRVARGKEIRGLEELLKDKLSVLSGQSGVGKSSLMNRLDEALILKTNEISKALGRGKHTTRHVELFELYGGWLADTPGFSSLSFKHMDPGYLAHIIPAFKFYVHDCQFRNCMHVNEPQCAIKKAVENKLIHPDRYKHYLEVLNLIEEEK